MNGGKGKGANVPLWMPLEFIGSLAGLPEPQDDPSRFLHQNRGRYYLGDPFGGVTMPPMTLLDRVREWQRGPRVYHWRPLQDGETILFGEFERLEEGAVVVGADGSVTVVGSQPDGATHIETVEGFALSLVEAKELIARQNIPAGRYPGAFFRLGEPVPHRLQALIVTASSFSEERRSA